MRNFETKTWTIANTATTSDAIDLRSARLVGIDFPAMTGATLGFEVSTDGTTFRTVYDGAAAVSLALTSPGYRTIDEVFKNSLIGWVKIVCAAQGAERTIKAVVDRGS